MSHGAVPSPAVEGERVRMRIEVTPVLARPRRLGRRARKPRPPRALLVPPAWARPAPVGRARPGTASPRALPASGGAPYPRRPPGPGVGLAPGGSRGAGGGRSSAPRRGRDALQRRGALRRGRATAPPPPAERVRPALRPGVRAGRVAPPRALAVDGPHGAAHGEGARGLAARDGLRAARLRPGGRRRRAARLELRRRRPCRRLDRPLLRDPRAQGDARDDRARRRRIARDDCGRRSAHSARRARRGRARRALRARSLAPAGADAGDQRG